MTKSINFIHVLSVLSVTIQGISFAIRHRSLLMSFLSFPKIPDDWTDKEKVRLFVIALATSDAAHELTKRISTRWNEPFRTAVAAFARQPELWNMAWSIIYDADSSIDIDTIMPPKTIRERIRRRFQLSLPASETEASVTVEGVKDLVLALQTVRLFFGNAED